MEARENTSQSPAARVDELERRMDQIEGRAAHTSKEAETRLRPQLSALRTRLEEIRTRLRAKVDADDKADDAALAQLGHAINDMYDEVMAGPK
jgi:hypothetical protein